MPEQYGMIRVPSAVFSNPCLLNDSSRQIMRNEATRNRARKHHGAQGPVLSKAVATDFRARS